MKKHEPEVIICIVMSLIFIIGVPAFILFSSYMEASTYRRLTGKQVTTWDAIWVDLRVQEQVK